MHKKVKNVDIALDDRNELTTTRRAWFEIRDTVERGQPIALLYYTFSHPADDAEAQARSAFLATLTADVVQPLTSLKVSSFVRSCHHLHLALQETQERTRKRIKEDLKNSSAAYADYAENMLPKLKRAYLRRCQDVEVCFPTLPWSL